MAVDEHELGAFFVWPCLRRSSGDVKVDEEVEVLVEKRKHEKRVRESVIMNFIDPEC